jgi:hypothetical protein
MAYREMLLAVTLERRFLTSQTLHTHQQLRPSGTCDVECGETGSFIALNTSTVLDLAQ